jgi:hypothetical protein
MLPPLQQAIRVLAPTSAKERWCSKQSVPFGWKPGLPGSDLTNWRDCFEGEMEVTHQGSLYLATSALWK